MFGTVDRYVVRSYLFSIAVCFGALVGLYLVVEISGRVTTLYRHSGPWGLGPLVMSIYLPRIPHIVDGLTSFVVLLAAMFTVSKMHRDNELLCLVASWVSIYRVLRPIFVVAVAASLLYVANRELVIPLLLDDLVEGDTILDARNPDLVYNFEHRDAQGNDFAIRQYRVFAQRMTGVAITVYYPPEQTGGRYVRSRNVVAREGHWRREADGQQRWLLSHGTVRFFRSDHSPAPRPVLSFGEDGFRIRRPGEKPEKETELVSGLEPRQIRSHSEEMEYYSTAQLAKLIEKYPELATSYHRRLASPVAIIVLLMLGLPFALHGYASNVFRSMGVGVFLCFAYYVADALCLSLGRGQALPAAAAAWLPVLVFGPFGFYLLDRTPT